MSAHFPADGLQSGKVTVESRRKEQLESQRGRHTSTEPFVELSTKPFFRELAEVELSAELNEFLGRFHFETGRELNGTEPSQRVFGKVQP